MPGETLARAGRGVPPGERLAEMEAFLHALLNRVHSMEAVRRAALAPSASE